MRYDNPLKAIILQTTRLNLADTHLTTKTFIRLHFFLSNLGYSFITSDQDTSHHYRLLLTFQLMKLSNECCDILFRKLDNINLYNFIIKQPIIIDNNHSLY